MMLPIYLYPISFFLLFWFTRQKRNKTLYSLLLLMYFFSSLAAIYVSKNLYAFWGVSSSWDAVIYHVFFTVLILLQFRNCDKLSYQELPSIRDVASFKAFTAITIILCLVTLVHDARYVDINMIMNDVGTLRDTINESKEISLIGYIAFLGKKYTSVAIALTFYYVIKKPQKKLLIAILLVCTLTSSISSLQVAGREYLMKFLFLFFIAYYITKKHLTSQWKRNLKVFFIVIAGLSLTLFLIITILRFQFNSNADSVGGGSNSFNSLLSYFGQGWVYFSDVYNTFQHPLTTPGAINFPFFAGETISKNNLNDVINVNIYLNQFSTALGSWCVDGGVVFGAVVAVVFTLILRFISRLKYNVFTLIYTLWAFEFIFSYMFFFNDTFNTSRIASILLVVFFDLLERSASKKSA